MSSLLRGTLDEAIEALAKRAADLRTRPPTTVEKRANGLSDVLGSVGRNLKDSPALTNALVGGGIGTAAGAGLGGLHAAWTNRDKDPSERRSVLGSAVTGGLAGGALGGGGGLAWHGLQSLTRDRPPSAVDKILDQAKGVVGDETNVDKAVRNAAGGVGAFASRAVWGLRDVLDATGLTEGDTLVERKLPFSSWLLPKAMLADAAVHSPGVNLGERLGIGRIRPEFSRAKEDLLTGVREFGDKLKIPDAVQKHLHADTGGMASRVGGSSLANTGKKTLPGKVLGRMFGSNMHGGSEPVASVLHTPVFTETRQVPVDPENPAAGTRPEEHTLHGKPDEAHLARQQAMEAKRLGFFANEKLQAPKGEPRGLFRFGPTQGRYNPLSKGGLIARLIGYGLIPLGEAGYHSYVRQQAGEQKLQELKGAFAQQQAAPGR